MYDVSRVGLSYCLEGIQNKPEHLASSQIVRPAILVDGDAVDEFHDQEQPPVIELAATEDCRYMIGFQIGQNLPFPIKRIQQLRFCAVRTNDLDGNELFVVLNSLCQVHFAHPASVQSAQDAVFGDDRSFRQPVGFIVCH
jgi:hypothetical protein